MKKKGLALLICLSLIATALFHVPGSVAQAEDSDSGIHTFQRIALAQNDGLIRYQYVDDKGNRIIPASSNSKMTLKKAAALPATYSSVDKGWVTPIKNQGVTGSCWAFGALKAMESSSIMKGISSLEETDYSENHLVWHTYQTMTDTSHPLYGDYYLPPDTEEDSLYDYGGNALLAIATLANWWGAVSEETAPFTADTTQDVNDMISFMEKTEDSLRFQSDIHLKEANCYDTSLLPEIKQAVMDYGTLDVAFYYSASNEHTTDGTVSYYQNRQDSDSSNHCVTIVGWDDNFDSFSNTFPPGKGAWLIANSYGEQYGDNGYFWLSYYDPSICEIYSFETEAADTYDTSFQYDGAGWSDGYYSSEAISLANVFTNGEDSPRQIEAASFYTFVDGQDYQIEVYRHLQGDGPEDGEPVSKCTVSGTAKKAGYHTISLAEPFSVAPGESFSIIVTFVPSKETVNLAYALMEGEGRDDIGIYYNSSPGQSYVYFAEEDLWYDNTAYRNEQGFYRNFNNVCVKALGNTISQEEFEEQEGQYTPESPKPSRAPVFPLPTAKPTGPSIQTPYPDPTPTPEASAPSQPTGTPDRYVPDGILSLTLTKNKVVIGKGEKISVPIDVQPASSKSQVRYTSDRDYIAIVDSSGQITGHATGTTQIWITTQNGVNLPLQVTVKKAPTSVRITVPKKKLKKKKTMQSKVTLSKNSASYQLTYRSLNPKIASVNTKGKIKGKKTGKAKIQVKTYNGRKSTVTIRVRP